MTASLIFDIAPLGSLVAYSDGQPKPPARFTEATLLTAMPCWTAQCTTCTPPRILPTLMV